MFNGIVFNTGKIVLVKKDTSSIVINVSSTIVLLISISNDSPTDTRSMFSF